MSMWSSSYAHTIVYSASESLRHPCGLLIIASQVRSGALLLLIGASCRGEAHPLKARSRLVPAQAPSFPPSFFPSLLRSRSLLFSPVPCRNGYYSLISMLMLCSLPLPSFPLFYQNFFFSLSYPNFACFRSSYPGWMSTSAHWMVGCSISFGRIMRKECEM
ncbi:hypothetical protein FPV67DRAFT_996296 [Lyophyllum atratum]|nr:hypothetical protein FPV67DRAFT_996296 [Lyophyllum atratum]